MAMRASDFPELQDTPLRKIWFMAVDESPAEYSRWINIVQTRRAFEDDLRMAEFGQVPEHTEGNVPLFEDAIEAETRRYTPKEYVLGYTMTQTMREDELHGIAVQMTKALRRSVRNLFEVESYKILNNATTASAARDKGFDALALLSTAHTNAAPGFGTQANKPSTDATLSQTVIENAVKAFHGWTGEKGLPILVTPKIAIVHGNDQFKAAKLFRNAMRYDTANNENNWTRVGPDDNGINKYIASRYFTASNQWFILSDKASHDLNLFIRVQPQFETWVDPATGNYQAKARARLVSGFSHWLGVYGSKGY